MFTKYKIRLLVALALVILLCLAPGCGPSKHVFQKYDFSFQYCADTEMTIEKGSQAQGKFSWAPDNKSLFWLDWYSGSAANKDVKEIIEISVKDPSGSVKAAAETFVIDLEGRFSRISMVPVRWEIKGQPTTEIISGYKVSYQFVGSQPGSGVQGVGICAIWYCEDIDKLFILRIVAYNPLTEMKGFLKSFKTKAG